MSNNINVICFGEVLWDDLPTGRRVGGAPLNVCYHLNKNGISSQIVSQVGDDPDGRDLLEAIEALHVDTRFVTKTSLYPTSRVEVSLLEDGQAAYHIVEQVAWDYLAYDPSVAEAIAAADALVFGSLAARNPVSRKTLFRYLDHARYAVFDVNLRQPFYSPELIKDLMARCHVLKINHDELELLTHWLDISSNSEHDRLEAVLQGYPDIREIVLTKGAGGACYHSRETQVPMRGLKVDSVSTVGSGDSFLAAFLARRITGQPVADAMRHAITLSAFVATRRGACPPYTDEVLNEFKQSYQS